MHVLVTGAGSFIGGHAIVALSRAGLRVTATFRSESSAIRALKAVSRDVDFLPLDLARKDDFLVLPKSVDSIVHIAGVSSPPAVAADDVLGCNVLGAQNLINYASTVKVSRVIVASTLSIYGDIEEAVVTERTVVRNPDLYGASKLLAERLFAAESHCLPCVALRLPGVLGKGAHRAWIPTLLEQIRRNEDVTVYNPQSMFNNAAHVDDLNNLFLKLLEGHWSGFHSIPIAAAGEISIENLVRMLILQTGSRSGILEGKARKQPFTVSSEYAIKNFGYNPMNIEIMLDRYVDESS